VITATAYAYTASRERADQNIYRQLQAIYSFAEKQKVKIIEEFHDVGTRVGFSKMVGIINSGELAPNFIYVYDYSRLSRDFCCLSYLQRDFEQRGIKILPVLQFKKPKYNLLK
jgi:DNA invertase Pin-like site-specific DNA recombinase